MTTKDRGRLSRRPWLLAAGLAGLAAARWACFPGSWFGAEGDEALYALLARGLAAGRYSLGTVPGDPLFSQITPGFPALLLPAALAFPASAAAYQLLAFGFLCLCDALVFAALRRRAGARGAAVLTVLFSLNPLVLSRSGVVMPEAAGLCLALAAVLAADRARPLPGWAAGALAGAAYLVRPGLLPLAPALVAAYAVRRRGRDAAAAGAVAAAAWGGWRAWASAAGGFSDLGEGLGAVAASGWSAWPRIAAANAWSIAELWGRTATWSGRPGPAAVLAALALGALAAAGLARALARRPAAWALFLAGSLLLHAFWPWWYERYLVGLLPFLLLAAWEGGRSLGVPRRRLAAAGLVLAALPLAVQGRAVARRAAAAAPPAGAYRFLAGLPPDRLVAAVQYGTAAWYAGRPVVPLPLSDAAAAPEALARARVGWVLWTGAPDVGNSLGGEAAPARALARWDGRLGGPGFRPVWSGDGAAVYEVTPEMKVTGTFP